MRTAVALAVALVGFGVVFATTAGAVPRPHVERASSGAVEAVFSYSYDAAAFRFTQQRLAIKRDRMTSFSAVLRKPPGGGLNAQPSGYFMHRRSVSVTDVDGDGEPEVVLDLYWGGAHCCWYSQLYRYVPATKHYAPLVHVWGNFGYVLADLDHNGQQELVTRDDRFSYAFASFADSRWPVRILSYRAGRLTVATPAYRSEIGRDANALWHAAMNPVRKAGNQGIVAAWAADEAMVGHWAVAFKAIDRLSRSDKIHGERSRVAFEEKLRRFLRRTGYLP
ncbi:MAG TPA: VCBS repeat-containing protein [Gaiellaceae bacterium]|nr:VCBS repeat-containing protein [Gaiellaceae bacterium]